MSRYSVVGLGKLGAPLLVAIASRGFDVIGVDLDPAVVAMVNEGLPPVREPGLEGLIREHRSRLRATRDVAEAVRDSEATFVVVPTPSDESGGFSTVHAESAMVEIGRSLRGLGRWHLVVLTSTVLPGSSRALVRLLEQESGLVAGRDFGFCYSPEFIALGSVVRDLLEPDFLLVGELDDRSGAMLASHYAGIVRNGASSHRMSLENAELAKLAVNSFVTTKIAFANTLAAMCESIPGGDVDAVVRAVGSDRRIGAAYLHGGLGFGGPCFPRDNAAVGVFARSLGLGAELADATDRANALVPERVLARLSPFVGPGTRVAVLGLAYKPGTWVTEASQALALAGALAGCGASVAAFDPLVQTVPRGPSGVVDVVGTLDDALAGAHVVVVATPDKAFLGLADRLAGCAADLTVFDCWRILDAATLPARARYLCVGRGDDSLPVPTVPTSPAVAAASVAGG